MKKIALCESAVRPRVIKVASSAGDGSYYEIVTETMFNEAICDCKGFNFRGACRHLAEVPEKCNGNARLTPAEQNLPHGTKVGECQACGGSTVVYDLDPEFV